MANESPRSHATNSPPQVGSIVRARLIDHPKATRRALVATVQDERTVCVLYEDEAPRIRRGANNKPLHRSFLVTPVLKDTADEVESDISVDELIELLPFEKDPVQEADSANDDTNLHQKMQEWKEHGDQLLRLGDATAAAEYYEAALGISRNVQIGSSIILKVGGHTKIAEVDCIDADDNTMDVAIETGEEKTIPQSEALIAILEPDNDRLQERILLNLARCMLQLAEVTTLQQRRRPYVRGAVLAISVAISVTCFHNADADADAEAASLSPTHKSALLLRSQAQVKLSKFKHAKADLKQLLVLDPEHREGQKRLRDLEKQQIQKQKTDKRLAKDICQWVGTATEDTVSDPMDSSGDKTIAAPSLPSTATETNHSSITSYSSWFWVGLILLAALSIQKA
jgi:tetratricopeptide (TPR) repeat protein